MEALPGHGVPEASGGLAAVVQDKYAFLREALCQGDVAGHREVSRQGLGQDAIVGSPRSRIYQDELRRRGDPEGPGADVDEAEPTRAPGLAGGPGFDHAPYLYRQAVGVGPQRHGGATTPGAATTPILARHRSPSPWMS